MNDSQRGTGMELALCEGFGIAAMNTQSNSGEVRAAIERGLKLAEELGERRHILYLLDGLDIFLMRRGQLRDLSEAAKRCRAAAQNIGSDYDIAMADWRLWGAYHGLGDQAEAQHHLELGFDQRIHRGPVEVDFFVDHRVGSRSALGRVLWLRGFADRAVSCFRQAIEEAERSSNHPRLLSPMRLHGMLVAGRFRRGRGARRANFSASEVLEHWEPC